MCGRDALLYCKGLLIVGGGEDQGHSAELFLPTSGYHCFLTDLPSEHHKAHHVQLEDLLCGGYGETPQYSSSCIRKSGDSCPEVTDLTSLLSGGGPEAGRLWDQVWLVETLLVGELLTVFWSSEDGPRRTRPTW